MQLSLNKQSVPRTWKKVKLLIAKLLQGNENEKRHFIIHKIFLLYHVESFSDTNMTVCFGSYLLQSNGSSFSSSFVNQPIAYNECVFVRTRVERIRSLQDNR